MRLRLGIDEVGEPFDFGQVELAVLEGTARELAGLGEPCAGTRQHRVDDTPDHRAASMHVKLGHVFAGEASRALEPEHKAAVEKLSVRRSDCAQARLPGGRRAAANRVQHVARVGTGDADHRDCGKAGSTRRRNNGAGSAHDGSNWNQEQPIFIARSPRNRTRYPRAQAKELPCRSMLTATG